MILGKGLIWSILVASVFTDEQLSSDPVVRRKQISQKCGKENNFEEKDYEQNFHKIALSKDASEKYLCFLKCFHYAAGTIEKNGSLNFQRVDRFLTLLKHNDEDKKKIKACLKETKSVNKCTDVIPIMRCIPSEEN